MQKIPLNILFRRHYIYITVVAMFPTDINRVCDGNKKGLLHKGLHLNPSNSRSHISRKKEICNEEEKQTRSFYCFVVEKRE